MSKSSAAWNGLDATDGYEPGLRGLQCPSPGNETEEADIRKYTGRALQRSPPDGKQTGVWQKQTASMTGSASANDP